MEHAPIYRSSSRRTNTALIPWRRTASLASAAAALTMSGIALGYHGFAGTPMFPSEPVTAVAAVSVVGAVDGVEVGVLVKL